MSTASVKNSNEGLELGELDESVFTKISWDNIQFITKDPNGFYMKKVATPVKVRRLHEESRKVREAECKASRMILRLSKVPDHIDLAGSC